ncbi:MAG TPA: nucleotide-diphospho-sugar transferase [Patescibacteria group bacterium]|nr:nucleotide-diphospho-sugar transferase [Patescibacteria group bacterium]
MKINTPILFLIFNRPDKTKKAFAAIRKAKPRILFVAADGPRRGNESDIKACSDARKVTENIDWKCKVKRLYRNENIGIEKSIPGAIDWFFNNVNEGIILEDDCLPDQSLFDFCSSMLKRYKNDKNIMLIRGSNLAGDHDGSGKYYMSKYIGMWGWATWKRSWKLYDSSMKDWGHPKTKEKILSLFDSFWEKIYWKILLNATYYGKTNSWGYRWMYSVWKNEGKIITPNINLVKNLGFKGKKTHFVLRSFEIDTGKINKPYSLVKDNTFAAISDNRVSKNFYGINPLMVFLQFLYYAFQ